MRGAIAGPVSDTLKLRLALGTVEDGGIAHAAGLRTGDRVVSINGTPEGAVAAFEGLDPLDVVVERDGAPWVYTPRFVE